MTKFENILEGQFFSLNRDLYMRCKATCINNQTIINAVHVSGRRVGELTRFESNESVTPRYGNLCFIQMED